MNPRRGKKKNKKKSYIKIGKTKYIFADGYFIFLTAEGGLDFVTIYFLFLERYIRGGENSDVTRYIISRCSLTYPRRLPRLLSIPKMKIHTQYANEMEECVQ